MPAGTRAGVLTQPSWLVAWSMNQDNHAILRGKWVRERLSPVASLTAWLAKGPQSWQTLLTLPTTVEHTQVELRRIGATVSAQNRLLSRIDTELSARRDRRRYKRLAGGSLMALGLALLWQPLSGMVAAGDISLLAGMVSAVFGSALIMRA